MRRSAVAVRLGLRRLLGDGRRPRPARGQAVGLNAAGRAEAESVEQVSTLELFFDLVFVFTITQLTSVLLADLGWRSLWHVAVMLGLIFYIYDGYVWLTNAVPARGGRRERLLLGGMAGYLVLSIAVPGAFGGTAVMFGLALLVITAIHAFLFARHASADASSAIRRLAPRNLAGAGVVVLGGALGGLAQELLWTAVFLVEWFGARAAGGFAIGPAHFVERHGLLIIVVLGESVVAIGVGASRLPVDAGLVGLVVLGLAVSAALWWAHFEDDAEHAVRALGERNGSGRLQVAVAAFGYAHFLMLLGVILAAVGIETAIAHPGEQLEQGFALALGAGVALFLLGDAWYRTALGLGRTRWRLATAGLVCLSIPFGSEVSAVAGLAATVALLLAAGGAERRTRPVF